VTNQSAKELYTALTPIEAIRIRPGMYIGDTDTPTQLLTEVIDNSFDEVSNGFANLFQLNIVDGAYWVQDNGRGIKSYQMKDANGNIRDSIELLCTETHSGSKFNNDDYKILIGMHGVGMVVVNALSNWMIVKVRDRDDRNTVHEYQFVDAVLQSRNTYVDSENIDSWSTCIGFQPYEKHFDSIEMNLESIVKRLMLAQARYNSSDLYFNGKQLTKRSFYEYVKYILNIKKDFKKLEIVQAENKKIELYLNYCEDNHSNILCDVNLRHCEGTFLTTFLTLLKKSIIIKLGKMTNGVNPKLLLNGLNCYISLTVPEPKFDSQTKVRMTLRVTEMINSLQSQVDWFLDQDTLNIIQSNLEKLLKKKFKGKFKKSKIISAENKLRDCIDTPGETLYIVEGESALGPLKQIRNVQNEAIFPLRGKVLNVQKATMEKIGNNREITDLIEACGAVGNRRYKHIKIISDADSVSAESLVYYYDNNWLVQRDHIYNLKNKKNIGYISSLNKKTGSHEFKKILNVISHPYDKKTIWKMTYEGNYSEEFTDDHVVYVFDSIQNRVVEKSPTTINIRTDFFLIPKINDRIINKFSVIDILPGFYGVKVKKIEQIPYKYDEVFDLEVEDNNNFGIGPHGVIIHNSDGLHISVLAILVIYRFLRDYIEDGNLSVVLPPLFGVQLKNEYKLLYSHEEAQQPAYAGHHITRFKGLGEMNPDQLELCIRNNMEYVVTMPDTKEKLNNSLDVIVNTELKKQIMTIPKFTFNTVLSKVLDTNKSPNPLK